MSANRTKMRKEVTVTTIDYGKIEMIDRKPVVTESGSVQVVGNLNMLKASKHLDENVEKGLTVFDVSTETKVYEAEVLKFVEIATEIKPNQAVTSETTN